MAIVILTDSVLKIGKNYYSQVFLEECKYIIKDKKINKYISNNLEISFDDSDKESLDMSIISTLLMNRVVFKCWLFKIGFFCHIYKK